MSQSKNQKQQKKATVSPKSQTQTRQTTDLCLRVDALPCCVHPDTAATLRRISRERGRILWRWSFSVGERAVLRHRPPIPVSEWAEKHRVVNVSSHPGRWHNQVTPYTAAIMDVAFHPSVQLVVLMKSPQSGGTEAIHNCIGYTLDRAPGPVMYVYPDEGTARENAQDRIIPMIMASPRLREYLTGLSDDVSSLHIKLAQTTIHMAWSGSAARLGNKPIRYLVLDELDKYQGVKREASAEALAEKRVITWGKRAKIWKISTPTVPDAPIDAAFKAAELRFRFHAVCPSCGCEQLMDFEHVMWPEEEKSPALVRSRGLGFYECQHCQAHWTDADRDLAVRNGCWREEESGVTIAEALTRNPYSVAFHLPAWVSPFVSLSEIAAKRLEYETSPSMELLKDLQNNYKAEPWKAQFEERSEEIILALCDDRPRGAVPGPLPEAPGVPRVACLLAGVDTQGGSAEKGYFRYVIRAFGWGEDEESWLVQAGVAPSFAALDDVLWRSSYRDADGREYPVRACMIDAMGLRTSEVYAWAVRHRGRVFPWQGVRSLSQPYSPTALEYFPDRMGRKVRIPGGLNLWRCDSTFFKSDLSHKLAIAATDPGAFHLHENADGILAQYAREMCAEAFDDEKQAWVNPHGKPNHFWDCETMALALAYIFNLRSLRAPAAQKEEKPAQPAPKLVLANPQKITRPTSFSGR